MNSKQRRKEWRRYKEHIEALEFQMRVLDGKPSNSLRHVCRHLPAYIKHLENRLKSLRT